MPAPLTTDIQAPFDPTGFTSISGAMLLQLVAGAFPQVDKGFILVTVDDVNNNPTVPNATAQPKWQNYVWIRRSATSVSVYVWNQAGAVDAIFLQWQSINIAGIAAGSIVNSMIADFTIQSAKIVSLDYSKITGAPTGLPPSGAAGGVLSGTYPNPSIANLGITAPMIANNTITAGQIALATLTLATFAPVSGSAKDMSRVNAGATGMEAFTPPVIFTSGVVVPTANAGKIPQVNAGATDFQMVAPTTLGRILQIIETEDCTADNTASNYPSNALPTTAAGKHYVALDTAITPLNAASTLLIEVLVWMASGAAAGQMTVIALMQDAIANSLAAGASGCNANAASINPVLIRFKVASGSLVARTYKIYFAGTNGTTYINGGNAGTIFGAVTFSAMRVTEYL